MIEISSKSFKGEINNIFRERQLAYSNYCLTLSLDVSALYGEGQGGTEAPAQLEGGVGVQTQVQQKLQGLKKRGHILISANKQGWGAGAAWKKSQEPEPLKNWPAPQPCCWKIKGIRKLYLCYSSLGNIVSFYG